MAALVQRSEYHAFASFTFAATTYYIGTQDELRAGNWYDGVVKTGPQLAMAFNADPGVVQSANVDLVIANNASGTYRALAVGNILDGTPVTVSLVMRQYLADGTTSEQVYTQILTIVGVTLNPGTAVFHLQDIEEQRLQALYPPNTWQSSDWPELSSDDAGKPICAPVGTAIKLPAVLLHSDSTAGEYWYGVCTGTPKLIGISSINSGTKTITLTSAPLYALAAGQVLIITGSSAADGRYTVASASGTTIVVNEPLPASTGGSVRLMPQVLTVYRNKRVVSASEYSIQQGYVPCTVQNGSFSTGLTGWETWYFTTGGGYVNTNPGTGSNIATGTNNCTITSVSPSNYAFIRCTHNLIPFTGIGNCFFAVQVTVASGGADAQVCSVLFPEGTGPYICKAGKTTTVLIAVVSAINYWYFSICARGNSGTTTVTGIKVFPISLTLLKFSQPQIDFNGSNYVIECDCAGVESQNASTEIQRLLTNAGATADATTFTAAASASFSQLVDCDYGRSGQRRLDAIIADLLMVARGGLSRNGSGAYTIWQDVAGSPALTLDESAGDPVNVTQFDCPAQPLSVGLSYAPSSADANQMQVNPLTRPVTGGILGAETPYEIRYLRDATTADALLCYRALRRWRGRKATATVYGTQVNIGDKIALTSPRNWSGAKTFIAWEVQRVPSGNALTLLEYDAAVYTYTAGTLPPTAPTGYQPDYSFTPPLAPSALKITATAAVVANDGTTTSNATIQATPPTVNWSQIWFAAVHNVTGEILLASGASIGGGNYGVTLGPLRPGEVYRLQCYAVNGNNVQGMVQSTFDATAIGGGGAVTTFTTAGLATAPPTIASVSATQALGSNIIVSWPAVSGTNIGKYVLERKIGAGSFAQCYAGMATSWTDSNLAYSNAYQYRARAQDTYGNFSAAYATSSTVTPTGNVYGGSGGDIGSTTVATVNRTNTSTFSSSWNSGTGPGINVLITHSLGKIPVLGAITSGSTGTTASASAVSTSQITVVVHVFWPTLTNFATVNATPSSHQHAIVAGANSGTTTVDVW